MRFFCLFLYKLRNGSFVIVPPALVQRCKTHFHTLPCGVNLTLGLNGYIWVSKHTTQTVEELAIYSNENEVIKSHNIIILYCMLIYVQFQFKYRKLIKKIVKQLREFVIASVH